MFVRLALEDDFPAIVEMAKANVDETRPELEFSPERMLDVCYAYVERAEPTIFVAEHERQIVGMLLATIRGYRGCIGLFTTQDVLYVRPEKRGTRAAVLLTKELVAWSARVGAREIIGGNDNGFRSERTARFLEHFGFKRVGFAMRKAMV